MLWNNRLSPIDESVTLSGRHYASIAMVLLLFLGLTSAPFHLVRSRETETLEAEFEHWVNDYVAVLQETINRNVDLIESLAGLYAASQHVERSDSSHLCRLTLSVNPKFRHFHGSPASQMTIALHLKRPLTGMACQVSK